VNVVDSSAWLEYFADGPNAEAFSAVIEEPSALLVPTLSLFEVFKRICQQVGEEEALGKVALMEQGQVVDLDRATALEAARLALAHRLPMAGGVMLATAQRNGAILWTQDADFEGIEGVRYLPAR
jgi:toxin FitB